ncbi:MAG: hypothetical protein AAFP80_01060 [Pseudomonadota bacterium]
MKKSIIKRFLREEQGTAYIMASIAVVPMFGFAALAIDYSNIDRAKTDLETTTQMVALHVAKRVALNPDMDGDDLVLEGRNLMNAVTDLDVTTDPQDGGKFTVDMTSGKVQIVAKTDIETHFMHMFGYDIVSPTVKTQAQFGRQDVEVAIAIDNSGSMGGSGGTDADGNSLTKIQAAKQAAYALIDAASAAVSGQTNATVKFSIVPWDNMVSLPNDEMRSGASATAGVNSGTWEDWIDWDGHSTSHFNYLAPFRLNQGDMYYNIYEGCTDGNCDEWRLYHPTKLVDILDNNGMLENDGNGVNVQQLAAQPGIGLVTRKDVFSVTNTVFKGCFEHRAGKYRYKVDAPSVSNWSNPSLDPDFDGDSLYVPIMAPDEADIHNGSSDEYTTSNTVNIQSRIYSSANSYLNDQGGSSDHVQGQTAAPNQDDDELDGDWQNGYREAARLFNSAKYHNPASHDIRTRSDKGPNGKCDIAPVLPLSDDIAGLTASTQGQNGVVKQAIDSMYHGGNTDVTLGLLWAMNTLTPWEPIASGGEFDETQKVLVVITDGDNVPANSTQWDDSYSSLQYPKDDVFDLIDGNFSSSKAIDMFDDGTEALCTEIKQKGVTVYFVSFDNNSSRANALSSHCASRDDTAISATNSADLIAAFEKIGDDIGKLRLTAFDDE